MIVALARLVIRPGDSRLSDKLIESFSLRLEEQSGDFVLFRMARVVVGVLHEQGRYGEVKELLEAMLKKIQETPTNQTDLDLVELQAFSLDTYQRLGQELEYDKVANSLLEAEQRHNFGEDHTCDKVMLSAIERIHFRRRNYLEATKASKRILEASERQFGLNDPRTVVSMTAVATGYYNLNWLEKGRELFNKAIEANERLFGRRSPLTLLAMTEFARCLLKENQFEEAYRLSSEVAQMTEKVLGPIHAQTLSALDCLACVCFFQRKHNEAGDLRVRLFERYMLTLGPKHPMTLRSLEQLAEVHIAQKRYDEVVVHAEQLLNLLKQARAPDLPEALKAFEKVLFALIAGGRFDRVRGLITQSFAIFAAAPEPEDPGSFSFGEELAVLCSRLEMFDTVNHFMGPIILSRSRVMGSSHESVVDRRLFRAYAQWNRTLKWEAIILVRGCARNRERSRGPCDGWTRQLKGISCLMVVTAKAGWSVRLEPYMSQPESSAHPAQVSTARKRRFSRAG